MATVQDKIAQVVKSGLDGGDAHLETLPNGSVCGHVIAREFDGKTYEERRRKLNNVLQERLSDDEFQHISMLLTYTPEEWEQPLLDS